MNVRPLADRILVCRIEEQETKRGKHLGADIPMCGVPIHAADQYLQRLIALGYLFMHRPLG